MDDNDLISLSFIVCWIFFIILFVSSRKKKLQIILNLSVHVIYSLYYFYGIFYRYETGTALAWWLFILFCLWIHTVVSFIQIVILLFQKK